MTLTEFMQFIGGGSMVAIGLGALKALRDSRDELRDLRRDLGRGDLRPATGLLGRVEELEDRVQAQHELLLLHGIDRRKADP